MHDISNYLQWMGICRWRLRPSISTTYYGYELYTTAQSPPVGLLLADVVLHTEAEKNLVTAIAKATRKIFTPLNGPLGPLSPAIKVVILLGTAVAEKIAALQAPCPCIYTHAPAALLANEKLKAETWQAIKQAMQLM